MSWLLAIAALAESTACSPSSVCEVASPVSAETADALLGARTETLWVSGDILTVVARRDGEALLCCAIQYPLHAIGHGIQAVSVRVPDIDSAVLDINVLPLARPDLPLPPAWRGPRAPAPPPRSPAGTVREERHEFESASLGDRRGISIYVPPGLAYGQRVPVIYLADGTWPSFTEIADAAIREGRSGPFIIVGIDNPRRTAPLQCPEPQCDPRNQESLIEIPGASEEQNRFDARARFVLDEVIPFIESHYPALRGREGRATMGRSSGSAWAVAMAARYPETFGDTVGFSLGWAPAAQAARALGGARVFLASGQLEPDRFREQTAEAAALASAAGADVRTMTANAGHDFGLWDLAFADAITWLFPPTAH